MRAVILSNRTGSLRPSLLTTYMAGRSASGGGGGCGVRAAVASGVHQCVQALEGFGGACWRPGGRRAGFVAPGNSRNGVTSFGRVTRRLNAPHLWQPHAAPLAQQRRWLPLQSQAGLPKALPGAARLLERAAPGLAASARALLCKAACTGCCTYVCCTIRLQIDCLQSACHPAPRIQTAAHNLLPRMQQNGSGTCHGLLLLPQPARCVCACKKTALCAQSKLQGCSHAPGRRQCMITQRALIRPALHPAPQPPTQTAT